MTQEDLFEWAKQMEDKYGINEEQLMLPFVDNEISVTKDVDNEISHAKKPVIKVLDEDDGYHD
tara:strand:- start:31909 stop:32097 length:189 start_codon:yes stop_codon:yes gene_type:complete